MFLLLFGHGLRGSTKVHQNSAGSAFDALAARCARLFHASSTFSPQRCANPDSAPRPKFSSSKRSRSRVRAAGCTGCVIFSSGGTSVRASPLSPQPTYLCRSGCASTAPLEVSVAPSGFYLQPRGASPLLPARAFLNRCKHSHFFGAFCAHPTPSAAALGAHGSSAADAPRLIPCFLEARQHVTYALARLHADLAVTATAVRTRADLRPPLLCAQVATSAPTEHLSEASIAHGARAADFSMHQAAVRARSLALARLAASACPLRGLLAGLVPHCSRCS